MIVVMVLVLIGGSGYDDGGDCSGWDDKTSTNTLHHFSLWFKIL